MSELTPEREAELNADIDWLLEHPDMSKGSSYCDAGSCWLLIEQFRKRLTAARAERDEAEFERQGLLLIEAHDQIASEQKRAETAERERDEAVTSIPQFIRDERARHTDRIATLESRLADAEGSLDMIANGRVTNTNSADEVIRELRRIASAALARAAAWREGKSWQQIVGEWADATFPASSQETIIAHLRAEVNEEIGVDCDPSELADVGLLLLHLAHKRGVSLDALMRSKHEVNKRRTWQLTPNERGFMSHTEEADHAD